jgi:hypothetical protein
MLTRSALDARVPGPEIPPPVSRFHPHARAALVGLCLLAAPFSAAAQDQGGEESSGLVGLSLPLGARVVGQGRAASGAAGELQALPYNPAAIVGLERGALTYSRFEAAELTEINGNYLAGAYAAPWGTVAVHAVYLDYGDITVTEASPDPVGTLEVSDWAIGLTYAHRWRDKLAYGATAKWLQADLGATDASGPAFDVGLVYEPRAGLPLGLAVAIRNLGPDLEFSGSGNGAGGDAGSSEALPSRVRIGVHYHPTTFPGLPSDYVLSLSFDIESILNELATSSQHAGAALTVHDVVVLRGGLMLLDNPFTSSSSNRNTGGSVGVGVRLGGFEADVAREISVSELGDETHISVSWRFRDR